jgi:hypothetical protein|tara:strand:+ start:2116 stop:2352 length:237 start_codon:yes stop_codon:yes gene_type:complete
MKEYAVQKQLIPADTNAGDPNWAKRQIWVYKLNVEDTFDEYDTTEEAQSKRDELDNEDPSARVYRVVKRIDKFNYEVI